MYATQLINKKYEGSNAIFKASVLFDTQLKQGEDGKIGN